MKNRLSTIDGGTLSTVFFCVICSLFFIHLFFIEGESPHQEVHGNHHTPLPPSPSSPKESEAKSVFLTFDDGPSKQTKDILRILKEEEVDATFFVVGDSIKKHEDLLQLYVKEGHSLGLHSMTHRKELIYPAHTPEPFLKEMAVLRKLIQKETGVTTDLIRAPYGSAGHIQPSYETEMIKNHYKLWDWTVDSFDWRFEEDAPSIIEEVKAQTSRHKEVVLFHEKTSTVKVLREVIRFYKKEGYVFKKYDPAFHFPVNQLNNPDL